MSQFRPPSQPGWGSPEPEQQPFPPPQPPYTPLPQPQQYEQWQQPPHSQPLPVQSTGYYPWPQQQGDVPQQSQQPSYAQPDQYQQPQFFQQLQPSPPQQQPWQYPPMMPIQPQRPPKKKTGRIVGIGCGSLVALVIVIAIIAAAASGNKGTGSPSTDTTTPAAQTTSASNQLTSVPTSIPTTQPTSKPTQAPSKPLIGNQVVVGGTEDAFNAKFGNPTSQQTQNGTEDLFYDTGNSNIGQFAVVLVPGTRTVYGIAIEAPTGQPWDATTALLCVNYMPGDATLDQPHNVTDSSGAVVGLYQGGHSVELANSLSPGLFNDASGNNLVAPGTFSVKYTYSDSSGNYADVCAIRLGQQSSTS